MRKIEAHTLKDLQAWLNAAPWPVEASTPDGYSAGWVHLSDLEHASWCPACWRQLAAELDSRHGDPGGWPEVEIKPSGQIIVHWSASRAHMR